MNYYTLWTLILNLIEVRVWQQQKRNGVVKVWNFIVTTEDLIVVQSKSVCMRHIKMGERYKLFNISKYYPPGTIMPKTAFYHILMIYDISKFKYQTDIHWSLCTMFLTLGSSLAFTTLNTHKWLALASKQIINLKIKKKWCCVPVDKSQEV